MYGRERILRHRIQVSITAKITYTRIITFRINIRIVVSRASVTVTRLQAINSTTITTMVIIPLRIYRDLMDSKNKRTNKKATITSRMEAKVIIA